MSRVWAVVFFYLFLLVTYIYKLDGKARPHVQGPQWGSDTEPQPLADGEVIDTNQPIKVHPNLDTAQAWLNETNRASAAIVILVSSEEYTSAQKTVVQLEKNFNARFQYPYVFINDHPYEELFRQNMYRLVGHRAHYGVIDTDYLDHRIETSIELRSKTLSRKEKDRIIRKAQMDRYSSGHIFSNPILRNLDYIWLMQPGTELTCEITYDPFLYMQKRDIKYGWNIARRRDEEQINQVLQKSQEFIHIYPEYKVVEDFFMYQPSKASACCEFQNHMQIFDARVFRGVTYWRYFEWMDQRIDWMEDSGQSVLSQSIRLFLKRNQVHFFSDIGIQNGDTVHCPQPKELRKKCTCRKQDSIELNELSCAHSWYN